MSDTFSTVFHNISHQGKLMLTFYSSEQAVTDMARMMMGLTGMMGGPRYSNPSYSRGGRYNSGGSRFAREDGYADNPHTNKDNNTKKNDFISVNNNENVAPSYSQRSVPVVSFPPEYTLPCQFCDEIYPEDSLYQHEVSTHHPVDFVLSYRDRGSYVYVI